MKANDLKKGMTVKWLHSPFDKHWTHGTFVAFGYSARKSWVRDKKGFQWRVNTRDLLRPWQTWAKEFEKHRAKKKGKKT